MKATKIIIIIYLFLLAFSCQEEETKLMINQSFIRFHVLLDNNKNIILNQQNNVIIQEVDSYTHSSTEDIKIVVLLTRKDNNNPINVNYSVTNAGNFKDYSIEPKIMSFKENQVADTITVKFVKPWPKASNNVLKISLIDTDDNEVTIGYPRSNLKKDVFTIVLGDIEPVRLSFQKNLYELQGKKNEVLLFPIEFSRKMKADEIANIDFLRLSFDSISSCNQVVNTYAYKIEKLPFVENSSSLNYQITLLEDIDQLSNLGVSILPGLNGFSTGAIDRMQVKTAPPDNRTEDIAKLWYNTADPLHRTYGKAWYLDESLNTCRWSTFSTFTKPVAVDANSPYNNGKGFHKYKIGFVGNNLPVGTNPFDLRRYYNGASVESPAFNLVEALEFFPDKNNKNEGLVEVIAQPIKLIRSNDNKSIIIDICGSGTYKYNSVLMRWELYLELLCDESAIGGGLTKKQMYIYSNNIDTNNPADLALPCSRRRDL